jgi:cell division protein ZapA
MKKKREGLMAEVNKVEVVIGGEIITLVSGEHEDYMQKLARYIDRKLNEIRSANSNASINDRTRSLFIAINIADDYFKTLDQLKRLETEHQRYVNELGRMQEENYLLTDKIHDLQDSLNIARKNQRAVQGQNVQSAGGGGKKIVELKRRPQAYGDEKYSEEV